MKKNVLLTIEYDGTGFHGWQRQPEGITIQGELEKALSTVCNERITVNGTSRTDAGVHALGQRASFLGNFRIPVDRIPVATNNVLAGGANSATKVGAIWIKKAEEVSEDFHARFDAKGKKYIYQIRNDKIPDIFTRNYCYQITEQLDENAMARAAEAVIGTYDFKCFQSSGGEGKKTTVRTVRSLEVTRTGSMVKIEITGDGFLYNMVRIISGTLVEVGLGKRDEAQIKEIIEGKDRQKAGHTAPPQGLYLAEVYFA